MQELLGELSIFNQFDQYKRLLDLLKLLTALQKDRPDLWQQIAEYSRKRKESNAEVQSTRT